MIPLTKQERIKEIEKRLSRIQRSTKTLFPRFDVVHNYLRQHSGLYERWHIWPYSRFIHWTFFSLYTVGLIVFSLSYFGFFSHDQRTLASSNIPKMLNYSGRLADKNNLPVADGNYNVRISIYDSASGGNCLWTFKGNCSSTEAVSISVSNGMFSIMLGDTASYAGTNSLNLDFNSDSYYLGVTVGSDSEMKPRRRVGAVAFAYNSDTTDGYHFDQSLLTAASPSFAGLSVDTNTLHIDSSNDRVGIGTADPSWKMTISSDANGSTGSVAQLTIRGTTDGNQRLHLGYDTANDVGYILSVKNGEENKPFKISSRETWLNPTGGNVGIGTVSPTVKLQVQGTLGSYGSHGDFIAIFQGTDGHTHIGIDSSNSSSSSGLRLMNGGTSKWGVLSGAATGNLGFYSYVLGSNVVSLTETGNVGIGTTAPSQKLEIGAPIALGDSTNGAVIYLNSPTLNNHNLWIRTTATGAANGYAHLNLLPNTNDSWTAFNTYSLTDLYNSPFGSLRATPTKIYIYSSKTGSGSYLPLVFHVGGSERAAFDTNGNLGIGTTTPQSKLDVEGGVAIGATYSGTSVAPSNGLIVEGNVGIGTTAPTSKLTFGAASTIGVATLDGTDNSYLQLSGAGVAGATRGAYLQLFGNEHANLGSLHLVSGLGDASANAAIKFFTGTGPTERMRITYAGLVGIKTTAPTQDLSFGGDSARTLWLERHTTANTAGNNLTIQSGGATSGATDKAGGTLILSGGISTGGGESSILFKTAGTTATGGVSTATLNGGGTGYVIGDELTLNAGGTNATLLVKTVDGSGVIQTFSLGTLGAEVITTNAGLETYVGTQDDGTTDAFTTWGVTPYGSLVEATATAHGGSNAVKFTRATGSSPNIYKNTGASTITPGAIYEFSFWTRGDGANQGKYSVYDVTNGAYIDGLTSIATGVTGTTYTQVKVYFTAPAAAPAGCTQVRVYFINAGAVGAVVYYDDASLKMVTANAGSGYSVASAVGVTGGTGASATFNITGLTGTGDNSPTTKMSILGDGKVGIGTESPAQALDVVGAVKVSTLTDNAAVYSSGGVLTNTNPSSLEYKLDINQTDLNPERLLGLQVKSFKWQINERSDYGLIAEDVKNTIPELYSEDPATGTKGYKLDHLAFYMLQLIQKQQSAIDSLSGRMPANQDSAPVAEPAKMDRIVNALGKVALQAEDTQIRVNLDLRVVGNLVAEGSVKIESNAAVSGKLGVGTENPAATLDVNGFMRLKKYDGEPAACSAENDGSIVLTSDYNFCTCKQDTGWVSVSDGSTCSW